MSKVTIYIPSHNYGRFLEHAVESVLAQSYQDWELILIDEASTDDTSAIIERYAEAHPERIRVVRHAVARGLLATANEAIEMARGKYVMRLDADDWLDDNALLVMAYHLDQHPELALVYPNYIYVDEAENHLGVENRKRIGEDSKLLDLPAHGACTMVRRRILKSIGGYEETFDRQDGYQLWLKISGRYPVANITTPLFFYRQHGSSLSRDDEQLLDARAKIKQAHVERLSGPVKPRIVGIVGAKNSYERLPNVVLGNIAGRPLISYTLDAAVDAGCLNTVVVTTDDQAVADYCESNYPEVIARLRPERLSGPRTDDASVVNECLTHLANEHDIHPDIVVLLSLHSPLRNGRQIRKALDTLLLYDVDSVISISENQDLHFVHGSEGLEPLNPSMHRQIRTEREGLYTDNGSIRIAWTDIVTEHSILGQRVGHVTMPYWHGMRVKSRRDAWLVEQILKARKDGRDLQPDAWLLSDKRHETAN